jgi:predicted Zn-dependent protease
MARFVFGNGRDSMGTLSTYRFRTETASRNLYLERISKEIIKILGMASGLSSCRDHACIMVYHRTMDDVDRNWNVCSGCRGKFVRAFLSMINDKDGKS